MSVTNRYGWAVKVSHDPTGESVTITSRDFRSMHKAKITANKILRSRIFAKKFISEKRDKEVAAYDLPDGVEYPHDLSEFRLPT